MTPLETVLALIATVAVFAALWLLKERFRLLKERFALISERDLAAQRFEDGKRAEEEMRASFRSLASESLQANNEQFLALAEQKLVARQNSATAEMDKRKLAVDQLLKPISDALDKTQQELGRIEKQRAEAYTGLTTQVKGIAEMNSQLRDETSRLVRALSNPAVRGRYGEIQLQRVAELAGMQQYCDFNLQASTTDEDGVRSRPDMVVNLPNGRVVAVDSKMSLQAYLVALEATEPEAQEQALKKFADDFVRQTQELGKKSYWTSFDGSPELVVLFVPGDQFLDAALQHRPDLIEISASKNVVLASPSTLIGLLRAVHVGWREKSLTDSAEELFKLGHELHDRVGTVMGHAEKMGSGLKRTLKEFNAFVSSVDSRLLPTLRRFEERGAKSSKQITPLDPVDGEPRAVSAAPAPSLVEPTPPAPQPEPEKGLY